jgi:hypothetical protein
MDKNVLMKVNDRMRSLVGMQGLSFGRVAAMIWINFKRSDLEFALHLQCAFRVRCGDEILVTDTEIFEPSDSALSSPKYDPETFDWDIQGANQYDEWVSRLNLGFLDGLSVVSTDINNCGDLTIQLSSDIAIDVFVNAAADECWRFFEIGSGEHLVMTGNGLETEA